MQEERTDFALCGTESAWPAILNRNKTNHFKRCRMPCQPAMWLDREQNFPKPVMVELMFVGPLSMAVVKGLKILAAFIMSAAVAKSRFVLVGWWLPCCSPSLEMDNPIGGLPGQRLSILEVLGGGAGYLSNEAALPVTPELQVPCSPLLPFCLLLLIQIISCTVSPFKNWRQQ